MGYSRREGFSPRKMSSTRLLVDPNHVISIGSRTESNNKSGNGAIKIDDSNYLTVADLNEI